jgi:hypothetical protein
MPNLGTKICVISYQCSCWCYGVPFQVLCMLLVTKNKMILSGENNPVTSCTNLDIYLSNILSSKVDQVDSKALKATQVPSLF